MSLPCRLAGAKFASGSLRALLMLPHIVPVVLMRDPENPIDMNAVKVCIKKEDLSPTIYDAVRAEGSDIDKTGWLKLGFVNADFAAILGPHMDRRKLPMLPAVLTNAGKLDIDVQIPAHELQQ